MSTLSCQDALVDGYQPDDSEGNTQTTSTAFSPTSSSPSPTARFHETEAASNSGKTEAAIAIVAEALASSSRSKSSSTDRVASFFRLPNGEIANAKNTVRSHGHPHTDDGNLNHTPDRNVNDIVNGKAGEVEEGVAVVDGYRAPPSAAVLPVAEMANDAHDGVSIVAADATTPSSETKLFQKTCLLAVAILLVIVALATTAVVFMTLYLGTSSPSSSSGEDHGRATNITNFINSIKLSEETLVVPTSRNVESFTYEQEALTWVIYYDPLQLLPDTDVGRFHLQQRYAIVTLLMRYYRFPESFFTNRHECNWTHIVVCYGDSITEIFDMLNFMKSGTLSSDLGLLTRLTRVDLSFSGTTGTLPDAFAQWTNLEHINLAINDVIKGTIPASFVTAWTNLKYLDLSYNDLTGTIPASVGAAWSNLETFNLSRNDLTGTIPPSIGAAWSNLETFHVLFNDLTGSIPASIGAAWINLKSFDVSYNAMTGNIPSSLDKWKKIRYASFENNSFVGSMPNRFCGDQVSKFEYLLADCEVSCPCCSACYNDDTGNYTVQQVRQ